MDDAAQLEAAEEAVAIALRTGQPGPLSMGLISQSASLYRHSGYAPTREKMLSVIADLDRAGQAFASAAARMSLGNMALHAGQVEDAEVLFLASAAAFEQFGDRSFYNVSRSGLADVARQKGDWAAAVPLYQEVIGEWLKRANTGAVARCLECLAFLRLAQVRPGLTLPADQAAQRQAATLLGAAGGLRETRHASMLLSEQPEYAAAVDELRGLLEPGELQPAWDAGRQMTLDAAVCYAGALRAEPE